LSEIGSPSLPLVISCALGILAVPFFNGALSATSSNSDAGTAEPSKQHPERIYEGILFFACLAVFFSFVFMVNNLMPLILKILNYDTSMLGILVGAAGAGNVLTSIYLLRRSSERDAQATIQSMIYPAIGTALCFVLIGFLIGEEGSFNELLLIVSFLTIGTFSATFSIATNHVLFKIFSSRIGVATANFQAVQNISILLAPLAGAYILDHSSPKYLFLISSVTAVIALLVTYVAALGRSRTEVSLSE
jgi:predicted MFS family arabinose efflux permease